MEAVAELVENRLDLVDGEQTGLTVSRSGHVTDIQHDRTHLVAVLVDILVAENGHPGSSPLGRTGVVVGHEYSEQASVGIGDLEGLYRRIVHRDSRNGFHVDAIDLVSRGESTVADILHLEIRPGLVLVKGIFPLAHLLGIVEPVPRHYLGALLHLAGGYVLVHDLLHVVDFLLCLGIGSLLDLVQELVDRLGVVSHLLVQGVGGVRVETEHPGLLGAEFQDLEAECLVVIFIAVVAPG